VERFLQLGSNGVMSLSEECDSLAWTYRKLGLSIQLIWAIRPSSFPTSACLVLEEAMEAMTPKNNSSFHVVGFEE